GFFLQALTPDADPRTSEALFVALPPGAPSPAQGERMRARGWVAELAGVTGLHRVELLEHCGNAPLQPERLELSADELPGERWEGMWITLPETWTLLDTSELRARGEVSVSSTGRRYAPGHPLGERAEQNAAPLWVLSGLEESALDWARAGLAAQRLRLGARTEGMDGVVLTGSARRLGATGAPDFRAPPFEPPRDPPPGSLRIVALNLDNYFAAPGVRGASSAAEHARQRAKLVAQLGPLDADILALTELGNDASDGGVPASLSELLGALNSDAPGSEPYQVNESGADGSDVIRSAIAYRTRRVRPAGSAQFANSPVFRRAPVLQVFEAETHRFTVAVVHFKSKSCSAGESALGAEGCGALARQAEARELAAVSSSLPPHDASELLLIGDFNSDAREAPLAELRRLGLVDLLDLVPIAERYSYVFEGRASLLDHALASSALAARLAQAQIWHSNADAPELLGYDLDNPPDAYQPNALRASDHDPLVIDLEL
ncbi:MAG TPA: ExeM/NucH family extracellular endonuclease, partial [Polyangiaceae bacterium]|nr:ExeM/NucH family extracellular endonuclease [Polyangiaceae bacterium]